MSTEISTSFLQGQVIALAYALRACVDRQANADPIFDAIQEQLGQLSDVMLTRGKKDYADGVERIRMAMGATATPND